MPASFARAAAMKAGALLTAVTLVLSGAPSAALAQTTATGAKALVYCPVGVDVAGCDQIVAALTGSAAFPGGVTRAYDGTSGTVDLAYVTLSQYAALVIPSLADDATHSPYAVLRSAAVQSHVKAGVTGRVAVWGGTPDLGESNRDLKNQLLKNLASWAATDWSVAGTTGLVVLADLSADAARRYDWLAGVSRLALAADPELYGFDAATAQTGTGKEILRNGSTTTPLAYANMASFGLVLPTSATLGTSDAFGIADSSGTSVVRTLLVTAAGAGNTGAATIRTDKADYPPGDTVTFTGAGWTAGETVSINLHENPTEHPDRTLTAVADSAGAILNRDLVMEQHHLGVTFYVTAKGGTSGVIAQTSFTDGNDQKFGLTPSPSFTHAVGSCVAITVTTQNNGGNATDPANPRTFNLSGGTFYTSSACTGPTTASVSITSPASSATVYYTNATIGAASITVTVSGNPYSPASANTVTLPVTIVPKLAFTTPARSTAANVCSAAITVQTQRANGAPISPTAATDVGLTSSAVTGTFYTDAACATPAVTSVSIPTSGNSATFYYKDAAVGSPVVTATLTGTTAPSDFATQTETISAAGFALTVTTSGTGTGAVTSSPAGINCGATCLATFPASSSVTLTESPSTGSFFSGWSGACTGTATTCSVTMDAAKSVVATFGRTTTLTVDAASGTFGGTTNLRAVLAPAVIGKTIAFTLNGNSVGTATTDASGVATIAAASLTGIDAGSYATGVGASFAGDAGYGASSGTAALTVGKTNQTITFAPLPAKTYGDAPFAVIATAPGGAVTFASTTATTCSVSGSTVTILAIGTCTIRASQSGGTNYNAAPDVDQSFTIGAKVVVITPTAGQSKVFGTSDPATFAFSNDASLAASAFTGSLARAAGENVGTYAINSLGTLSAGANYSLTLSATPVTFAITPASVSIALSGLTGQTYDGTPKLATVTPTPTSPAIVAALVKTYKQGAVTVASPTNAGSYDLTVTSSSANFSLTGTTTGSLVIGQATPSFAFDLSLLPAKTFGDPDFSVYGGGLSYVSSNSTATPTFALGSGSVGCTVTSDGTVTITGAATGSSFCVIAVSLPSAGNYLAAGPISQSFHIAKKSPTVAFTTTAPATLVYHGTYTPTATTNGDGALTIGAAGACSIAGGIVTMNSGTGTCDVTATTIEGTNYAAGSATAQHITASKASQTISFTAPSGLHYGDADVNLGATASSGLSVVYTSSTTGVCTIVSGKLHIAAAGSCTITADQAGNANFDAAPSQERTFSIAKASVTIAFPSPTVTYDGTPKPVAATSVTPASFTEYSVRYNGAATVPTNAGTYTVSAVPNNTDNYELSASSTTGTLTIERAVATVSFTGTPYSCVYSGSGCSASASASGLAAGTTPAGTVAITYSGQSLDGLTVLANSSSAPIKAGNYTATATYTPGGSDNYKAPASAPTASVTITRANQAAVTLSGPSAAIYHEAGVNVAAAGGSGTGSFSYSAGGSTACTVDAATGAVSINSGTGSCSITATRAGDNDYNVSSASAAHVIAISKAPQVALTLSGVPATAPYLSGFTVTPGGGSSSAPLVVATSGVCSNVGNDVTMTSGTGSCTVTVDRAADDNYLAATRVSASATATKINQAALTLTQPTDGTFGQKYALNGAGGSTSATITYALGGSDACQIGSDGKLEITKGSGGTCAVTASRAGDDNYNPVSSATLNVTLHKATTTIVLGTLTFTYDGSAHPTTAATPELGAAGISITYDGSPTAPTNVKVGGYAVSASLSNNNYEAPAATGTLTINPKPVVVTPAAGQYKIYGAADPALAFTNDGGLTASAFGTTALSRAAGENVGTYAIQLGTLSAGINYALSLSAPPVTFEIRKKAITVAADPKTKVYGNPDPALTYTVPTGTLVAGDAFSGALTRAAGETVTGSPYAITQGTLTAGGNYDLTVTPSALTITPRPVTVKAVDVTRNWTPVATPTVYNGIELSNGTTLGNGDAIGALGTPSFSTTPATPVDVGVYPIAVSGLSNSNYTITYAAGLAMGKLTIVDASAPTASITGLDPVPLNTAPTLLVNVTDVATGNSNVVEWQYQIDGGSWSASIAVPSPAPNVNVQATLPAYTSAGVHNVCARGKDAAGNWSVANGACALLAVYDPNGGFVTGGGWIMSPASAYTADPALTGKATFGFVSKYQNGATKPPTGSTEFQFHAGGFNFKSTAYEWLTISGPRAQYKGSGTVNGSGDYGFLLTAVDGEVSGGGGTDKFRLKVWDKATSVVVYDNQMGADDTGTPTTVLASGSVVIHTK